MKFYIYIDISKDFYLISSKIYFDDNDICFFSSPRIISKEVKIFIFKQWPYLHSVQEVIDSLLNLLNLKNLLARHTNISLERFYLLIYFDVYCYVEVVSHIISLIDSGLLYRIWRGTKNREK